MNPDQFAAEAMESSQPTWTRWHTRKAVSAASSALIGALLAFSHAGVNGATLLAAVAMSVAVKQLIDLSEGDA